MIPPRDGDLRQEESEVVESALGDLFMHGSGEFAYALAEKGLIEEYEVSLNTLVWWARERPRARRHENRPLAPHKQEVTGSSQYPPMA